MNFSEAYREMRNGKKIAHENFHGGYWVWENDTIMLYCHDGRVLDIRQTEDVAFTFGFITEGKWFVMD